MSRFQHRTAVITGAAKGIGLAIANAFYQESAHVIILDVDTCVTKNIAAWGERGIFIACDIQDADTVKQAFAQITQHQATIHFLINNAGIQHYGSVTETSVEEWNRVININLRGAFLGAK